LSDEIEVAAKAIVGNLDENGWLATSIEEVAEASGLTVECVEAARRIVMGLEPVGCGALNVKECLLAQLEADGEGDSLAADLVRNHLEDLQPHRLQHLSKDTHIDVHVLNEEIKKVKILDPYPGRRYSAEEPIYVAPEVLYREG
jgi:RNA polymerase sigma-54 factor